MPDANAKPKALIETFGCQMNEHDSQRMREILLQEGYDFTRAPEEADFILLNSCSVREAPENKIYSMVGRLGEFKKKNPKLIIAVAGCVAQQEGKRILQRQKEVDIVMGTDQIFHLPELLAQARQGKRAVRTAWMPREQKTQNFIPTEELAHFEVRGASAGLAITKGCDNFCSFCIVPATRGRLVSREWENILAEAKLLIEKGAKEILLLGQNVNSYQAGGVNFARLLKAVADLKGLRRLRFTSPHPNDWSPALTDLMAGHPMICPSLHLPFQAGADRILQKMRRGHSQAQYLEQVAYLKEKIPHIGLSSDIIVGFPSETEAEFQETIQVMRQARFSQVYAFKYSPRPGTKADSLPDDVPPRVKQERLSRVLSLFESIREEILLATLGQKLEVLIDQAHPKEQGVMTGRTGSHLPVAVLSPELRIGDLVLVEITAKRAHSLEGRLLA